MKKLVGLLLVVMVVLVYGISYATAATTVNSKGQSNITFSQCNALQDSRITTATSVFITHCVRATCPLNGNGQWITTPRSPWAGATARDWVNCSNGNRNHFVQVMSDGCTNRVGSCTPTNQEFYCTFVAFHDCTKTSTGANFVPATTSRPTTARPTTARPTTARPPQPPRPPQQTTTPTQAVLSDNNLLAILELSSGEAELEFSFDPHTENYTLIIDEFTTFINVTAAPEDPQATIRIENNTEIEVGTPIIITVRAQNGDIRLYTINLKYAVEVSSNNRLMLLFVDGYDLDFDPDVFNYTLKIGSERTLNIEYETECPEAVVEIIGNSKLRNRSEISIVITAEDGSEATYVINIEKTSNATGFIIVILILGVAGFVGYKLVIRLMQNKKEGETTYEYE